MALTTPIPKRLFLSGNFVVFGVFLAALRNFAMVALCSQISSLCSHIFSPQFADRLFLGSNNIS
jgi:hypothetical protein